MSNEPRRVYWVGVMPRRVVVMTGLAVRYGRGWTATPQPGTARYVEKVYDSPIKASIAAAKYCDSQVRFWQSQSRRFRRGTESNES